ncbi:MAG: DUF3800 domain-containing protein [Deltaproteobacteria bacterium]|nr:DUF3800 domain-containing protein [Deltaproteobacteria bacterium]
MHSKTNEHPLVESTSSEEPKIFFDESGDTGNNFEDDNQPIFGVASICMADREIDTCYETILKMLGDKNVSELKASNVLKSRHANKVFRYLEETLNNHLHILLYDKSLSVFLKAYDFFLDPLEGVFGWDIQYNLHRRIAFELWREWLKGNIYAKMIRDVIIEFGRCRSFKSLNQIFSLSSLLYNSHGLFSPMLCRNHL